MSAAAHPSRRCDIFCTVIDNFGDAGVCWRLAKQLAAEYGWTVRLWIDVPTLLERLGAQPLASAHGTFSDGVEILSWQHRPQADHSLVDGLDYQRPFSARPAEVVIEAFGCTLPASYIAAMCAAPPLWLNLEYLSAEPWVADLHLLASPHSRLPLRKTFFFPGLRAGTGGVLKEADFDVRQQAFTGNPDAVRAFWHTLGVATHLMDEPSIAISLFAYDNPALDPLLIAWREGAENVRLFVPEGLISRRIAAFFGVETLAAGTSARAGRLIAYGLPFVDQSRYDQLLSLCDVNLVRGEDSFVRAQLCRKPFAWHIYPQEDGAHQLKLDAMLDCYTAALPAATQAATRRFWHAWNGIGDAAPDWADWWRHRSALERLAHAWAEQLERLGHLAGNLVEFCETRLK
ncbi:MAG: elongation factor P maturation arginine rhamnosyltransferase EarP [Janthinobacterium lividum]